MVASEDGDELREAALTSSGAAGAQGRGGDVAGLLLPAAPPLHVRGRCCTFLLHHIHLVAVSCKLLCRFWTFKSNKTSSKGVAVSQLCFRLTLSILTFLQRKTGLLIYSAC